MTLQVVDSTPGVFTALSSGSGQGAILLEDYSVNGPGNAGPRGRAAMVFMTVGGLDAPVIYAGPSPGLIWGLTQVNVIVPDTAPTGPAVPIVISFGNRPTQTGVTIAGK